MKTLYKTIYPVEIIPIYEMGCSEPVGHVKISSSKPPKEIYRCGYCGSLVVKDEINCPNCGGEY